MILVMVLLDTHKVLRQGLQLAALLSKVMFMLHSNVAELATTNSKLPVSDRRACYLRDLLSSFVACCRCFRLRLRYSRGWCLLVLRYWPWHEGVWAGNAAEAIHHVRIVKQRLQGKGEFFSNLCAGAPISGLLSA